jgi:hypothetical protein
MTDAPRKPFWKRKRWIAAAVLWLAVAYPLGMGPTCYICGRGWVPVSAFHTAYAPLIGLLWRIRPAPWPLSLGDQHWDWWSELADRHNAARERQAH